MRELLITSIDALAVGVSLHAGLSTSVTIWLHVSIICVFTFGISLVGLFLGKQILKLLKDKTEISVIIGGAILILLAVWVVLSYYLGI
ncbi:MAG: manganese efflux pump [Bacilli bacterium]|nr:manganese efflux pump [Bacilli bacterium]